MEAHGTGLPGGQHKGHSPDRKLGSQREGGGLLGPQLVQAVPGDTLDPLTLGTAGCPIPTQPPRLLLSDDWRDSPGRGPWTSQPAGHRGRAALNWPHSQLTHLPLSRELLF